MEELTQRKNTQLKILLPVAYFVCCFLAIVIIDLFDHQKFELLLDLSLTLQCHICIVSIVAYAYLFDIKFKEVLVFGIIYGSLTGAWLVTFPWFFKTEMTYDCRMAPMDNPETILLTQNICLIAPIVITICSLVIHRILLQRNKEERQINDKLGLSHLCKAMSVGALALGGLSLFILLMWVIDGFITRFIEYPTGQEAVKGYAITTAVIFFTALLSWFASQILKPREIPNNPEQSV